MPGSYPPEIRRQGVEFARAGTRVKQLAATFGMSEAAIYTWLMQEQIDRGEIEGLSTDQGMELAAAKRRIRRPNVGSVSSRPSWRSHARSTRSSSTKISPRSLYPVIDALTGQGIDVRHACRTLCVSESGFYAWKSPDFYAWKTRPVSPRQLRRIWPAGEIADVHKASGGTYGALRVTAELRHAGPSRSDTTPSRCAMLGA